ncbi:hypothetical protein [Streptomyces caatingaensis]|uniref:Gram-positive cocci surface proteins LPxTG domain-containing protein n=1 Tax=Streptomyces caatingaensis TaxID=1678637 RepID=A0A0K9XIV7_9ACTN|nr:hypothetical protein [Streptomyces caatingaensis]KNB52607.1 hypothetical protein AC230_08040 [Streptomyces caatingaensis]
MTENTARRTAARVAAAGALTAALAGLAPLAHAAQPPAAPAPPPAAGIAQARAATTSAGTLDTLARFFARDDARGPRDGRTAAAGPAATPRIEGATVPVYSLSPEFVAGRKDAPVAAFDYVASKAVSADGRKASVWAAETGGSWKVVNIASGDDETRYAAEGARKLAGGTVFREPQINAWYVQRGDRVLPLNPDAERAVGTAGTTLGAYRERVHSAYGDKLPGSAYAKKGAAGGYDEGGAVAAEPVAAPSSGPSTTTVAASAAAAAAAGLGLTTVAVRRLRRR